MSDNFLGTETPEWLDGKSINETIFSREFLKEHPMKSVNGKFYTTEGQIRDERILKRKIFSLIKPYVSSNLSQKVNNILEVIRMDCTIAEFPIETDRIHVANGTFYLNGELSDERQFCQNRFPVAVNLCAGRPERFLNFLDNLLYEEDIPTLQEYLGYCLIPCTKAQKMMIIIGKGGEGKSRLGLILKKMIGTALAMNSVQKIETNRFAKADLEGLLVMVDDDMEMTALPKTSVLKTLVTAESEIDVERKSIQSYQGKLYARFLCFGNGELTAVNDQSHGFYRRQLVLYTKDVPPDRVNDPFLVEKMEAELEEILMWCLGGLMRLINNNYQFTISPRAQANTETIQIQVDTVDAFMHSTGYITLDPGGIASSASIRAAYEQYCRDNVFQFVPPKLLITRLHKDEAKYGLHYGNLALNQNNRRVWGFSGIRTNYTPKF